jgi:hypothetical protein
LSIDTIVSGKYTVSIFGVEAAMLGSESLCGSLHAMDFSVSSFATSAVVVETVYFSETLISHSGLHGVTTRRDDIVRQNCV